MEAQILREVIPEIPVSEADVPHNDSDVWRGKDKNAYFSVSHHSLRLSDDWHDYFILKVWGLGQERVRLAKDFIAYFGEPIKADVTQDLNHEDKFTWLINKNTELFNGTNPTEPDQA
ncbi:MAG: hypothetical protein ACXWLH_02340 [Candidatus Saccharimonadales bacterium]